MFMSTYFVEDSEESIGFNPQKTQIKVLFLQMQKLYIGEIRKVAKLYN